MISGKFVLLRVLGEGAMSVVYEAKDLLIGRQVALKILHAHLAGNPEVVRRFRREAEATARIQHPNVVMVHEMGQRRDGTFFIIQELVAGENLRAHLDARGRLSVDEAIEIILPIMGALCAAHSKFVVHRDVKPENIVLTRSASGDLIPKLVDFGIAKFHSLTGNSLTNLGSVLGTVQYMSPEQADGSHRVDELTDVWAVGVVLFELCVGSCPFDGPSPQVILARLLTQRAPRLDAAVADSPKELSDILQRALEPDLSKRFSSMQAFRDALGIFASGRPRAVRVTIAGAPTAPLPESERVEAQASSPAGPGDPGLEDTVPASDEVPDAAAPRPRSLRSGSQAPPPIVTAAMGSEWLEPEDIASIDETPLPRDGLDRALERPPSTTRPPKNQAAAADHALRVNNLSEAIDHADNVLGTAPQDETLVGRMWLVKATAHRWLGDYVEAERCATEAADRLPSGDGSWYAALGYMVIANGYLGRREPLEAILEEINRIEVPPTKASVHTILLCRLAIFLFRTGAPDIAQNIISVVDLSQRLPDESEGSDAVVQAWMDLAHAYLAGHRGDVAAYLRRTASVVDNFTAAGDLRDACLQRSNIGDAYMKLGAHRHAALVLKESLDVAEPMRLGFVVQVKVNLGFALAHLNELDQALVMEQEAIEQCQKQRIKRSEACAWIYLAAIHSMRDEIEEATAAAERAIHVGGAGPDMRAYGLAMLARMLLEQREPVLALKYAKEAMSLLERLGGVEEGESLIRWVHALALRNNGQEAEGRERIAEAKRILLERANSINEPHWRQSFLEGVRDNDRLMQLAAQWLGG